MAAEMIRAGRSGSLVTLICDSGERYGGTYFNDAWLAEKGIDTGPFEAEIERFLVGGDFMNPPPAGIAACGGGEV